MLPLRPLTLREAKVRAFSVIGESVAGSRLADQSQDFGVVTRRGLLVPVLHLMIGVCWADAALLRGH